MHASSGAIGRRKFSGSRSRGARAIGLALAALFVSLVFVAAQPPQSAQALDGSQFNAGYIIDDSNFYNANAMSQAQIQAFLVAQEPATCSGNCLKNFRETTQNVTPAIAQDGNKLCAPYVGAANEPASQIIFRVEQLCGISAKVLLVTMQKEESLVTQSAPSSGNLNEAMGYNCPDSSSICSGSPGFARQVYLAASQFQRYRHSTGYKQPGVRAIAYHQPVTGLICASKTVNVVNFATAALYDYTPYTPNAAALANLLGNGDNCSSYGNRNFWVFYNNWFGSPTGDPAGALETVTVSNNGVTVSGWAVDSDVPSTALTIRVTGAGWTQDIPAGTPNTASVSAFPTAGGNHGFSATLLASTGPQPICAEALNVGLGANVQLGCINVTVPTAVTSITRTAGTDRYDTAVQIAKANFTAPVSVAYVASGENFPDALSVVPAAAAQGAPLLLTMSAAVPANVLSELKALAPARIVVVGGPDAITDAVVTQLGTITAQVTRVSGTDRYQTSVAVGDLLATPQVQSHTAYIVTGANFPDALSTAAAAGSRKAPVILVDGTASAVPALVSSALTKWGVTQVTVVGGPSAVSDAFLSALRGIAGVTSVTRVSGVDRFSTSAAINASAFPSPTGGFIATGYAYADGLTGGTIAGHEGVPLYLAASTCVPGTELSSIKAAGAIPLVLLGGTEALSPGVASLTPCS